VIDVGTTQQDLLTKEPVEGELLAVRIAAGSLLPEDALQLGIEIGGLLNRAHTRGLVHGSISPFTVAINGTGVHILAPPPVPDERGAAYRSPEQVRGETPDCRSDIYAFGALLYTMVTGQPPFAEDIIVDRAVLDEVQEPLKQVMQESLVSADLARVIAGCLEKDPNARRQRIQNAVIELKFAGRRLRPAVFRELQPAPSVGITPQVEAGPFFRSELPPQNSAPGFYAPRLRVIEGWASRGFSFSIRFWGVVGAVLFLAASGIAAVTILNHRPTEPVLRFAVSAPENTSYPGNPVVSPDGRYLTLSAVGPDGQRMLWLRPLDALRPLPIPGTEGGNAPFWSPDSQYIGFFAGRDLKKVQINKWNVQKVCDTESNPGGGAWNEDGTILFAPSLTDGLFKVASVGGKRELVLKPKPERSEISFLWPQFLPDRKHFLFFMLTNSQDSTGVYSASLDSKDYSRVLTTATNAVYAGLPEADSHKHGYLLFMRDRSLMGQGFNTSKMNLLGEPVTLAEDIGSIASLSLSPISVSNTSILVYQEVGRPTRQMIWTDRSGRYTALAPEPAEWGPPRISPDGRRSVAARKIVTADSEQADLMFIRTNGAIGPFTETPEVHEVNPVWSPDGQQVAFSAALPQSRTAHRQAESFHYDIFVKPADGGTPELLFKNSFKKNPTDWSRDGRWLIFDSSDQGTGHDIWAYSFDEHRAGPVVETVAEEHFGALSPNEKWLAYQSDETGRPEVYVQSFEGLNAGTKKRYQVSQGGGGMPRWRGDGTELFYLTSSGRMMSVCIRARDGALDFDPPEMLFQTRPIPMQWNWYDVSNDGQHFLLNLPHEFSNSSKINVVSNWTEKLKD
jgi:eukaryotic-like serine/threonine-protein kinase